jgi:uncharacterized protein YfaP (DUF2135 family)
MLALVLGHCGFAQAEDAAPVVQRLHPAPWHQQTPIAATGGDIHLAVYALRLAGLSEDEASQIARDIANLSQSSNGVAVIDATDGALLLFDGSRAAVIPPARRAAIFAIIRDHARMHAGEASEDLPMTLQTMADVTRAMAGQLASVDYYLVGPFRHNKDGIDFAEGYPNDGFLLLDDTPFALITPAPTPGSRLHVLNTGEMANREAYERFAALLGRQIFDASLASFSSKMVVGDLPPFSLAPPPDATLRRSALLRPIVRPNCAYDDEIQIHPDGDAGLQLRMSNPCRKNALVSTVQNGKSRNAVADGEGVVNFSYRLTAGRNEINVVTLDGGLKSVFDKIVPPLDDDIAVVQSTDKVVLVGTNPLRLDDSEVVLREQGTDRVWSTHAHDGHWQIETPLSPGRHSFDIDRPPGGGAPQRLYVNRLGGDSDFDRATDKGGRTGIVQVVLAWDDINDLDLAVECPDHTRIYYKLRQYCGGTLDVDANRGPELIKNPAENIYWQTRPMPGVYKVYVTYFKRNAGAASPYRVHIYIENQEVSFKGVASTQNLGPNGKAVYTFEIKPVANAGR